MNMSQSEWARLEALFHRARQLPVTERRAFVLSELDEGPLQQHLLLLLAHDEATVPPLDRGVGAAVEALLHPGMDLTVPAAPLGPYRVLEILGHGGMGVVYLAERADVGGRVAIKVLWDAPFSPALRARFDEEQRTLARLQHPGIVPLYHAGETEDGAAWFSMEYVDGARVTVYARERSLGIRARLVLFGEVCAAVMAAHEQLVVHGDLKPSNILVTREGRVRLLDWGVSRRLDRTEGDHERDHNVRVTVPYAPPEVADGGPIGTQADVYALGLVLYELLVDRLPRDAISGADAPSMASPLRKTDGGRREDWRDLDFIARRATAPEPANRYPSVEALKRDIERYLADLPLEHAAGAVLYPLSKAVRRHRVPVALAALALLAVTMGLVAHERSLRASRDAALAEAARNARLRGFLEQLFEGGTTGAADLANVRVATIIDNGIREARSLTADPGVQVEMLGSLGVVTERLGAFARADTLAREAVQLATSVYGAQHPRTLDARVLAARARVRLKDLDSADAELRRILALVRPEDRLHPVAAEVRVALGSLLRDAGRGTDAIPLLQEAVAIRAAADSTTGEYAVALRELGAAIASSGDLVAADSTYRRALQATRLARGPNHPEVAYLLANLGHAASQRGEFAMAEQYQRQSAQALAAWYGEAHYLAAAARMVLMQTLVRAGRFAEARDLAPGIIASYAQSPDIGPMDHNMAVVLGTEGHALSGLGDKRGALARHERALAIHRAVEGPDGRNALVDEANVARMRLELGEVAAAVGMLRSTYARIVRTLGPRSLTTAGMSLRLALALAKAGAHREVIALSVPALALTDTLTGGPNASSVAAREVLAASYLAVGDSAAAERVRTVIRDVRAGGPSPRR
jgi:tetratricopeptide (TPR) repeat protein